MDVTGRGRTLDWLNRLVQDRRGASAAEYALILAIVGGGLAIAAVVLGDAVASAINDAGSCISSRGGTCP
jgi:pilus assembly protein Flp/PilA